LIVATFEEGNGAVSGWRWGMDWTCADTGTQRRPGHSCLLLCCLVVQYYASANYIVTML